MTRCSLFSAALWDDGEAAGAPGAGIAPVAAVVFAITGGDPGRGFSCDIAFASRDGVGAASGGGDNSPDWAGKKKLLN